MIDRRELLQWGVAGLAAGASGGAALAQGASGEAGAFALDACSRNLQWCRTPQALAKAVLDMGLASVDLNIAAYPGHIDPATVKTDLPAFVAALKGAGVTVRCVTTPITAADSANAEAILDAAASAGIGYYTWSGAPAAGGTYQTQTDALAARFGRLAQLNEKYRIKGLYQPRLGMAGALFVDLLPVLVKFDPRYMAVRYDTASLLQASPQNVIMHLRMGGPYVGAVALNDAALNLELPQWRQGSFTDVPEMLTLPNGGGDNTGDAGGDPLAFGGGGRPLPYRLRPVPVGTGMIDLTLLGRTLKEIDFHGPAECQVEYPLGGAEAGGDRITLPRQEVIGRMKRDRLIVAQAFEAPWGLKVAKPPFMLRQQSPAAGGAAAAAGGGEPGQ